MAIKLADIFIKFGADSAELKKEFRNTKKQTRTWARDLDKTAQKAAGFFKKVAFGVTAANVALGAVVAKNGAYLDALGKTADKLGETTEGLQSVRLAGELAGIANNTLDQGLQRMVRRLSEAADGGGEAASAIKALGLNAQDLENSSPEKALTKILTELEKIPNQSDRVRLAFKFFDSEGVKFVNLTADAILEANGYLEQMGGHLSRLDVKNVENMNDKFSLLKALVDTTGQRITVGLSQPLAIMAEGLFDAAVQGDQFGRVIDASVGLATRGLSNLLKLTGNILNFSGANPDVFKYGVIGFLLLGRNRLLGAAIGGVIAKTQGFFDSVTGGTTGRLEANIKFIERRLEALGRIPIVQLNQQESDDIQYYTEKLATLQTEFDSLTQSAADATGVTDSLSSSFDDSTSSATSLGDSLIELGNRLENIKASGANLSAASSLTAPSGLPSTTGVAERPGAVSAPVVPTILPSDLSDFVTEIQQQVDTGALGQINLPISIDTASANDSLYSLQNTLGSLGDSLTQFTSGAEKDNSRTFKSFKVLQIGLATVASWSAAAQALAKPASTWYEQLAAYAAILGTGLSAVANIKSLRSSSGGSQPTSNVSGPSGNQVLQNPQLPDGPDGQNGNVYQFVTIASPMMSQDMMEDVVVQAYNGARNSGKIDDDNFELLDERLLRSAIRI